MMSSKSVLDKLADIQSMNPRWIYMLIILGVVIPTLIPLGLPMTISKPTKDVYDYISSLKRGSIVLFAQDSVFVTLPETYGAVTAMVRHIFSLEGVRLFFATQTNVGNDILVQIIRELYGGTFNVPGKKYGVDYIIMPYIPGGETFVAQLARDTQAIYTLDYFGNPVSSLPLFAEIHNGADITLLIEICVGPQFYWYIRYFNAAYGTKCAVAVVAYIYTEVLPYYNTGQFIGYMVGLRGAGEYEKLVGKPGLALAGADALSGSYIWIMAVIFIGNIANALRKISGRGANQK